MSVIVDAVVKHIDPVYFLLLSRLNSVWNKEIMKQFDTVAEYRDFFWSCDSNKIIECVFDTVCYMDMCFKSIKFGYGLGVLTWLNFVIDDKSISELNDTYYDKFKKKKLFERRCVQMAIEYNNRNVILGKCGKYHRSYQPLYDHKPPRNYIVEELVYALQISTIDTIILLLSIWSRLGSDTNIIEYDMIFAAAIKRDRDIIVAIYSIIPKYHQRFLKTANEYGDSDKIKLIEILLSCNDEENPS